MSTQQQIKDSYGKIRNRITAEHAPVVTRVAELVNFKREPEALRLITSLANSVEYGHMLYRDEQHLPDYAWLERSGPEAVRTACLQLHSQLMEYRLPQPQQRALLCQAVDLMTRGPVWIKRAWLLLYDLHTSIEQKLPAPRPLPSLDALPEAAAQRATESKETASAMVRGAAGVGSLVNTIQDSAFRYWMAGNVFRHLGR